jgi:methylglutaconyl-CoA hydratase
MTVVRAQIDGDVATLTLDSPATRNALSATLLADLHAALDAAEAGDVRVIVLDHSPPVFCAGADLKERAAGHNDSTALVRAMARLAEARVPTIAAVSGPVRAGGVGLMASCDLVVAHHDVTFAFTEVRLGVAPAIISVPILTRCTWSDLAAPFLTGETFDAARAAAIGLVSHVTEDVAGTVATLVGGVLQSAPRAVEHTKRLLRHPQPMPVMQALSEELFAGEEGLEGMRAFAERRPPSWARPTIDQ